MERTVNRVRDIKFHGKRIDNGEWVIGYLIGNDVIVGEIVEFTDEYFNTEYWYKVDPQTVGQYTGLNDGTKWEQLTKEEQNDWLQSGNRPEEWRGREIYEGHILEEIGTDVYSYVVHWNATNATYDFVDIITDETFHGDDIHFEKSEVIGNIYDNPELVKT